MSDIESVAEGLPDGRALITIEQGKIVSVRIVDDNEHVASLAALLDIAKLAGCVIVNSGNKPYN
ncbi:hypothetical protein [Dickeya dadantii]|uniref:hypothetical protein n=1 Tax=Dickeya dadantii TaxID=204038 RepID=UPI001F1B1437|nr:hypothetical protein [Dickeya dadantii]